MNNKEHRSTKRVIDILSQIADSENQGVSLAELSSKLDAPKSSVFPILYTLKEYNLIKYKTYELGNAFVKDGTVNAAILDIMHDITRQSRETCFFGELIEGNVFYLFKTDSPESLRMVSPGKTLPAYSSGIGKALLSDMSLEDLQKLYPGKLEPITPNTITDLNILAQQLQKIRVQGIAFEKEESTQFIQCIAIPIRRNGKVRAALSVAIPVFRYSNEKEAMIIGLLKQAQIRIEELISSSEWTHF